MKHKKRKEGNYIIKITFNKINIELFDFLKEDIKESNIKENIETYFKKDSLDDYATLVDDINTATKIPDKTSTMLIYAELDFTGLNLHINDYDIEIVEI